MDASNICLTICTLLKNASNFKKLYFVPSRWYFVLHGLYQFLLFSRRQDRPGGRYYNSVLAMFPICLAETTIMIDRSSSRIVKHLSLARRSSTNVLLCSNKARLCSSKVASTLASSWPCISVHRQRRKSYMRWQNGLI